MALRALNSVVAANYNKLNTDPILAGDVVMFNTTDVTQNPSLVKRGTRAAQPANSRGWFIGVAADDALGTNPNGETPTMINNDAVGSNFVNGSAFQSYATGFYVGAKRAIGDFKDEAISTVTNLTAGVPTYAQRGIAVYTTPGSQFITDRFQLLMTSSTTADAGTAPTSYVPGDLLTANVASGADAGKVVKLDPANLTHGPAIGRVDYHDTTAGLLYWTLL